MRKSTYLLLALVVVLSSWAFISIEHNDERDHPEASFNTKFAQTLQHAKEYTLEVAEAMPEEHFSFRPHDSIRSFGEQLAHIGMSTQFLHSMFIKGEEIQFDPAAAAQMEKEIGASKEKVIEHINSAFDDAITTLKSMDKEALHQTFVFQFIPSKPELTKEEGYLFIRDHITHHRGQAIIYLRMKDQKAPAYRPF